MVVARAAARCGGVALALLSVASCQWIGNITQLQLTDSGAGDAGDTDAGVQLPADAGAVADGALAGGSWCATLSPTPAACADFDESENTWPPTGWTVSPSAGDASATLDLDAEAAYSAPGSLLVQVPSLGANPQTFAYAGLIATFSSLSSFSEVEVELEYRAGENTDDKIVEIGPADPYGVSLVVNGAINENDAVLQQSFEDGGFSSSPVQGEISPGQWIKITLAIELSDDGGSPYASVLIGDAGTVQPLSAPLPASLLVRVGGIYVLQSPSGWSANFDNVAVYVK